MGLDTTPGLRSAVTLVRWLGRRPSACSGRAYRYDGTTRGLIVVFIGLTLLEGVVVDAVVFAKLGGPLSLIVLGLHVYTVLWLLSWRASWAMHPHCVHEESLALRRGTSVDIRVSLQDVDRITAAHRRAEHGAGWHQIDDGCYELPVSRETNVALHLRPGAEVRWRGSSLPVRTIHFYADEPRAMTALA
jgi:hypothetical protein